MLYYTKIGSLEKMVKKLGNIRKSEVMRVYGKKDKSVIPVPRQHTINRVESL